MWFVCWMLYMGLLLCREIKFQCKLTKYIAIVTTMEELIVSLQVMFLSL